MRFGLVYGFYTIVVFICAYVAVSQFSETTIAGLSKRASQTRDSFFKKSFLSILDERNNILNLESDHLVDNPRSRKVSLSKPRGSLGDKEKVFFESEKGIVNRDQHTLFLNSAAKLFNNQGVTKSDEMELNYKTNELVGRGAINSFFKDGSSELIILASRFKAKNNLENSIQYFGNVRGEHLITDQKKDKLKFKSNLLTYHETDKTISLEGDAVIDRALTNIHALTGKIWLNNQSDGVKYFTMNDDVRITDEYINSIGKKVKRFSYSERVEGFNGERKLVLSGFPQVKQEDDIIKGNKMIIREDQEVIEVINTNSQFNMKNGNKN